MNRIVSQSLAAFSAVCLSIITIGAIVTPPATSALAAAPILA